MEKASQQPEEIDPLPSPEIDGADDIEVFIMPVNELPEISDRSLPNQEFWTRRKLRPEAKGGNFNNLPIFGFGIKYEGDLAVLTVPSTEHINSVAHKHNPGGFAFVESKVKGLLATDSLLGLLSSKVFPLSTDRNRFVNGVQDEYREFRRKTQGEPYTFFEHVQNMDIYEHDRVDHLGLAVLPPSEADKIATGARRLLEVEDPEVRRSAAVELDRYLDLISEYATINADDDSMGEYRDWLWLGIQGRLYGIELHLKTEQGLLKDFPKPQPDGTDRIDWQQVIKSASFKISREAFDANIARMQELGR
jgi:hypothetical protein